MWEISTETSVAAAHQLRLAPGEGERLHGHNWRIKVTVRADRLDSRGFVMDFNESGPPFARWSSRTSTSFSTKCPPSTTSNPTAENIARVVFDNLSAKLNDDRVRVARLEVWENDTCAATYFVERRRGTSRQRKPPEEKEGSEPILLSWRLCGLAAFFCLTGHAGGAWASRETSPRVTGRRPRRVGRFVPTWMRPSPRTTA